MLVLNLLQPSDRLVPHDCYGGSWRLFNALAKKGHFLELSVVDLTCPRQLTDALALNPRLVWIETPSNPLLRITDLRFVIDAAHRAGALALVDNTFLRLPCSNRFALAPIWCCIPRPSTSTVIVTWWAAR